MFPFTKEQFGAVKSGCNCLSLIDKSRIPNKGLLEFFENALLKRRINIETTQLHELYYDTEQDITVGLGDLMMDILKITCGYCGKVLWEKIKSYDEF